MIFESHKFTNEEENRFFSRTNYCESSFRRFGCRFLDRRWKQNFSSLTLKYETTRNVGISVNISWQTKKQRTKIRNVGERSTGSKFCETNLKIIFCRWNSSHLDSELNAEKCFLLVSSSRWFRFLNDDSISWRIYKQRTSENFLFSLCSLKFVSSFFGFPNVNTSMNSRISVVRCLRTLEMSHRSVAATIFFFFSRNERRSSVVESFFLLTEFFHFETKKIFSSIFFYLIGLSKTGTLVRDDELLRWNSSTRRKI